MFLNTNRHFPFCVKRKVVEAAFNAAILYGCESWGGVSCQVVEKLYIGVIKCLLGVRRTAANDLCLIELSMSPLPGLVRQWQYNFLNKAISEKRGEQNDYFVFAVYITRLYNSKLSRHVDSILSTSDHTGAAKPECHRLGVSNRSKFVAYRTISSQGHDGFPSAIIGRKTVHGALVGKFVFWPRIIHSFYCKFPE